MIDGARDLATGLGALLGDGVACDLATRTALAIHGAAPEVVARPASVEELRGVVAETAARGAALVPLGLGAHRLLGHRPLRYDVALSTARVTRVLDYTPADMTVTVESGLTIAALDGLLAGEGQWLPVDPPLPACTTVGGLIAADLAGALRAAEGRVRDFLIGIGVVTADGRAARAGGRVVKNVAGYDLMKLFTGSLGTLAVVTQATFKVRPRPEVIRLLTLGVRDGARALALAERLAAARVPVLGAALTLALGRDGERPTLDAVLAGVPEDVAAVGARLLDVAGPDFDVVGDGEVSTPTSRSERVRDLVRAAPGELLVRLTTLPTAAPALVHALTDAFAAARGTCVLDACGGVILALEEVARRPGRDAPAGAASLVAAAEAASPWVEPALALLGELAGAHGARLTVERWPQSLAAGIEVWTPLPPSLPLMRRMKAALDPRGVLAPGRFVGRI